MYIKPGLQAYLDHLTEKSLQTSIDSVVWPDVQSGVHPQSAQ